MAGRFALYYAPPKESALAAFGRDWLGRDPETGAEAAQPLVPGMNPERLRELTDDPRRYGFHGTLKPPFALADGKTEAMLRDAVAGFAASRPAFTFPGLILRRIGRFIALTPSRPTPELEALAAGCVRSLDGFRRPAGEAELARRRKAGLTARQEALLQRWGYPYVMEEFRFHLTLTGSIADENERAVLLDALEGPTAGIRAKPVEVSEVVLFAQASADAPFLVAGRFPLGR